MSDKNDLAYWFPIIKSAGLPVPETKIITTDVDLAVILDGKLPKRFYTLVAEIKSAADAIGYPCFLRTGHGSGKHDWQETCYLTNQWDIVPHIGSLVEWSHAVDMFGLPTNTWVVRQLIPTAPLFYAFWGNMPITREFRLFVRDGIVETWQPYWPPDSLDGEVHNCPDWREVLKQASRLSLAEYNVLEPMTLAAGLALGGYWAVDWLQAADGSWWLTDMAEGDRSFRWNPATGESNHQPSFVRPDYDQILEPADE